MEEILEKARVMTNATPDDSTPATPRKAVPQKPLSLTAAAKAVNVSTSTLRRAINDKKLKAVKTDEGHYRIRVAELMQYRANELDTRAVGVLPRVVTEGVAQGATGGADAPADEVSPRVNAVKVSEVRIEGLETQIKLQKDIIQRLEGDVSTWQQQAKSWQNHADQNLRLLEDNSKKEPDINLEAEPTPQIITPQNSRLPIVAAVLIAGVLVAGSALYPDLVREKFVALTSVFNSETVAAVSE